MREESVELQAKHRQHVNQGGSLFPGAGFGAAEAPELIGASLPSFNEMYAESLSGNKLATAMDPGEIGSSIL